MSEFNFEDQLNEMQILGGHGISFPGYLHKSILESALNQKQLTGKWPVVDDAFETALYEAFASRPMYSALQTLHHDIEGWRERAFNLSDPVKREAVDRMEDLPQEHFDPVHGKFASRLTGAVKRVMIAGAKRAHVEIVGDLDPFYVWVLKVATDLMTVDVPAETFAAFIQLHMDNLYGSDSFEILRLAVSIAPTFPAHIDTHFLSKDYELLGDLLDEEAVRSNQGRSQFGSAAGGVLQEWAHTLYKIALGRAAAIRTSSILDDIIETYRTRCVIPALPTKLDNARYFASMLHSCGRMEEADAAYADCLKYAEMPQFAAQSTALWKANLYSNMAEMEIERGNKTEAEAHMARAVQLIESESTESGVNEPKLAEGLCHHAFNLLRLEKHAQSKPYLERARRIFIALGAPFWTEHTALSLGEVARASGDLSTADQLVASALPYITGALHSGEPYWIIGNRIRARLAASHGEVSQARKFYESCTELKLAMMGKQSGTIELFEEYAQFLDGQNLKEEAAAVRARVSHSGA